MSTEEYVDANAVLIRVSNAEEVPSIQAIELDATRAYGELPGYAFCVSLPARSEAEHAEVRRSGVSLVAVADGRLIGFILIIMVDGCPHVLEAGVSKEFQRRGVGRRLFDEAEVWSKQQGAREITLTTFRDVPWNAPAYIRRGYRLLDEKSLGAGLKEIVRQELLAGFARRARVVMRKRLGDGCAEPAT